MPCATTSCTDDAAAGARMAAVMRTFVIEDSALIRGRIIAALQKCGTFDVVGFSESEEDAIRSIARLKPDVVITDIRLKEGSGIEVVRQVRLHGYSPKPKIYVLTNYAYPEYKRQCALIGADDFFDKSTEYERFLSTLRAIA
jgi:DNA-binding NarL/FixJ family response regulator